MARIKPQAPNKQPLSGIFLSELIMEMNRESWEGAGALGRIGECYEVTGVCAVTRGCYIPTVEQEVCGQRVPRTNPRATESTMDVAVGIFFVGSLVLHDGEGTRLSPRRAVQTLYSALGCWGVESRPPFRRPGTRWGKMVVATLCSRDELHAEVDEKFSARLLVNSGAARSMDAPRHVGCWPHARVPPP